MTSLTYETILDFLQELPAGKNDLLYGISSNPNDIPATWKKLGTLLDEKLQPATLVYKPVTTHYALGFYPFNGCDIYEDENSRILFSYIEFGGHAPFRQSFVASKSSLFIIEPVCFNLNISEKPDVVFSAAINVFLTPYMQGQELETTVDNLPENKAVIISKQFIKYNNAYSYTIVAKRSLAHEMAALAERLNSDL